MQIQVLGPIRVRDTAPVDLDRPAQRRLLAILALDAGRRVSTDTLIDRFWPDEPPSTAKAALQTHISALRKALGNEVILTEGHGYRLDAGVVRIDSSEALGLAATARSALEGQDWETAHETIERALGLWSGSPYAELTDDDFAEPVIAKLEETRLELLEMRAEALLGLDRAADSLPDLESLIIEHPLRERLWEHLMMARYRLGRHTEALQAYQELSAHLAEMGLEPGQRLRRLEEKILLHDRSLTPTRHNLPVELSDFIGREAEMEQLRDLMADNRLVTLTGAGGSGKTRLAIRTAKGLLDGFSEGAWLVELASILDSGQVPTEIARAMGLQPRGGNALEAIVEATASGQILIVLDNCEHLLEGAAIAAQRLLEMSPGVRILATSREPLRVPGEAAFETPGMAFPAEEEGRDNALGYEAVRLFVRRAELVRPGFDLDEQSLPAVRNICERLDGMPLAIELAAARIRSLNVETIAERLDDQLHLLTKGASTAPPRQQTLHATIEWSYRLLESVEQSVLERLSVFRGGFRLDTAEEVVAGGGIEATQVATAIPDLVEKSLIATYETALGTRYRLLETVRQFASLRLRQTSDAVAMRGQHLAWCIAQVEDLWLRAVAAGEAALVRTLESEGENLQAALEWATETGDLASQVTLSQALAWRWYFGGHLDNTASLLRTALPMADSDEDTALMRALLARTLAYSEDVDGAISEAASAHALLDSVDAPIFKTWVVWTSMLGQFMSVRTNPRAMLPLAEEAAGIAFDGDDVYAEILARQIMADAYSWNGRNKEGLDQQRIAIDKAVATGDTRIIDTIYGFSIYNFMLDPDARRTEPLRVTKEWLSRFPLGPDHVSSTATDWLPWIHMQAGNLERADQATAWLGNRFLEGYNKTIYLMVRASMSWMRGNLREARETVEELAGPGVSPRWAHVFYPLAADIAADRGRLENVRSIAADYLAMEVHQTGEAAKLGVLNPLVRAEVDAAIETGSKDHAGRAQAILERMMSILEKYPPLVDSWTSIMTHNQNLVFARAEVTRLTDSSPDLWSEAAETADYAYYQLYARWRLAEALLQSGNREQGTRALDQVHADVAAMGAQLLRTRAKTTGREFAVDVG